MANLYLRQRRKKLLSAAVNMYWWNETLNGHGDWEREASVYTNSNFGGSLCLEGVGNRPVVIGVGGIALAKFTPDETDEKRRSY